MGGRSVLLTLGLYVPEFFRAHGSSQWLIAINYAGDTLLFGGTLLVVSKAIMASKTAPVVMLEPVDSNVPAHSERAL
jgi:hypothetical protein